MKHLTPDMVIEFCNFKCLTSWKHVIEMLIYIRKNCFHSRKWYYSFNALLAVHLHHLRFPVCFVSLPSEIFSSVRPWAQHWRRDTQMTLYDKISHKNRTLTNINNTLWNIPKIVHQITTLGHLFNPFISASQQNFSNWRMCFQRHKLSDCSKKNPILLKYLDL